MIPKPGKDYTKVASYRPNCLLSNISKVFEKLLMNRLKPIVNRFDCILTHQFGFRERRSTIELTHRFVNEITETFQKRKFAPLYSLTSDKPPISLWHEGLLFKINRYLAAKLFNSEKICY